MSLCAGDWVEVRSKEEILATLDKDGRLEGMPFMPEMFEYCGQKLRVFKRAHKACDTINPLSTRTLPSSVLLDTPRCSGAAHGGCQAQCTIFWKEAWLKPVSGDVAETLASSGCTEEDVERATRNGVNAKGKPLYRCQATTLPEFSTLTRTRNLSQFVEDVSSRNETLGTLLLTATYALFDFVTNAEWGQRREPVRRFYDWVQKLRGGVPYPRRKGFAENGNELPILALDLQPGELVRVKPWEEIRKLISTENKHRGLYFDAEMIPFCGGVYRVRSIVRQFLDEPTGAMVTLKTPAVILDNVWCRSRYSNRRLLCPRAIYSWWREAWLERAPDAVAPSSAQAAGAKTILIDLVSEERKQRAAGAEAPTVARAPTADAAELVSEERS
ncbi:MAG: hypothetical protein ABUL73_02855 [Alphaproteobacteria bacterium]